MKHAGTSQLYPWEDVRQHNTSPTTAGAISRPISSTARTNLTTRRVNTCEARLTSPRTTSKPPGHSRIYESERMFSVYTPAVRGP